MEIWKRNNSVKELIINNILDEENFFQYPKKVNYGLGSSLTQMKNYIHINLIYIEITKVMKMETQES